MPSLAPAYHEVPGMTPDHGPPTASLDARKSALRRRVLAARAALPAGVRRTAASAVRQRLSALEEVDRALTILGYAAFASELDLDPLLTELAARGRGVFLPRVEGDRLEIVRVRDLATELAPGFRGVREPRPTGRPPARIDRLQAVLAPGVAFDEHGRRLGYGGGYFDRLLSQLQPGIPVIGVAFEIQLLADVPVEPHDRKVDIVVTESRTLRPGGDGRLPPAPPTA